MRSTPLFVSLPPKMSRLVADVGDIGDEYASECVRSWRSTGFDPVSINSTNEKPMKLPGVANSIITRDASGIYGKSVPYLSDFLARISEEDGVVAITNADILFRFNDAEVQRIQSLKPDECIIMKRHDIVHHHDVDGTEYFHGYDFMAFHASVFRDVLIEGLAIGIPWWDHFLPLWFRFSGMKAVNLKGPILHLNHEERWDPKYWLSLGARFEIILRDSLHRPTAEKNGFVRYMEQLYRQRAQEIVYPDQYPKNVAVSHWNVEIIDEWRLAET